MINGIRFSLFMVLFAGLSYSQFTGGGYSGFSQDTIYYTWQTCNHFFGNSGSGYTSTPFFQTQCALFTGDSMSGYVSDTAYYTWQTCNHFFGNSASGYTSSPFFQTQCALFTGDSMSGYISDTAYYTWQTCSHFHGSIASGYNYSFGNFTQCPLFFGDEGSGYTYDLIFCTPLASAELLLTGESLSQTRKKLNWYLTSNLHIDQFLVQRSEDGFQWTTLTTLPGTQWSWVDEIPNTLSKVYYRIHCIGEISLYSNSIQFINSDYSSPQLIIYPNPIASNSPLHILISPSSLSFFYELRDINGKLVASGKGEHHATILAPESAGIYLLSVFDPNGETFHNKLIVY